MPYPELLSFKYYLVLLHKLTFLDLRYQQSAFSYQQKTLKTKGWLTADR